MTRLFTGDYSTGDFSQWKRIVTGTGNSIENVIGSLQPRSVSYSAKIVSEDPDSGFCARYELRNGDIERSEAKGDETVYAAADTTRWYAWSWKFDPAYPNDRHDKGKFGLICQWKSAGINPTIEDGSPCLQFGWTLSTDPNYSSYQNGYVHLIYSPQSSPGSGIPNIGGGMLLKIPLAQGQWQDFKARISIKKDTTGTFQLWHNGVRQTFLPTTGFAGGQTLTGQFIVGGTSPLLTGINFSQGIYRDPSCNFTEVVYHRGFRMADSEDSL